MTYDTGDSCNDVQRAGEPWRLTLMERKAAKRRTCADSPPCGHCERPRRWRLRTCESVVSRDVRNLRTRGSGRYKPSAQLTADSFLHRLHRATKRGFKCV